MTKNEVILGGCYMRQNERQWARMKCTWDGIMKGNDSPWSKIKISLHDMKWNWDEITRKSMPFAQSEIIRWHYMKGNGNARGGNN